ncbi:hypothetical protein CYMTET_34293 [Cymbomonas tetramitiformis]|uniref:Uncharacterized protein n=1 Tax=Cymbomonas tetramitiformis TaxID=36881 RepID=A0AAE0FBJ4_9CHLO|nr:hypothetical protein CYMTET_34293 [Cymbomonas tetramitiformis]
MKLRSGRQAVAGRDDEPMPLLEPFRLQYIRTEVLPGLASSKPEQERWDVARELVEDLGNAACSSRDGDPAYVSALLERGGFKLITDLLLPSAPLRLREQGCGIIKYAIAMDDPENDGEDDGAEKSPSDPAPPPSSRSSSQPPPRCTAQERVVRQVAHLVVDSGTVVAHIVALLGCAGESVKAGAWAVAALRNMLLSERVLIKSGRGGGGVREAVIGAAAIPALLGYLELLLAGEKGLRHSQAPLSLEERLEMDYGDEDAAASLARAHREIETMCNVVLSAEGRIDAIWMVAELAYAGAAEQVLEAGAAALLLELLLDGLSPSREEQERVGVIFSGASDDHLEESVPVLGALQALREEGGDHVFFQALVRCGGVRRLQEVMEAKRWGTEHCVLSERIGNMTPASKAQLLEAWTQLSSDAHHHLQQQCIDLALAFVKWSTCNEAGLNPPHQNAGAKRGRS